MQIRIAASATVKNITIYNVDTRGTMHIYHDKLVALTGSGIVKGDEIIITTDKGRGLCPCSEMVNPQTS